MVNDGTNTLTYDNNGNLTNDGTNTYTWDRANRLLNMGGIDYTYNGDGNRVSQGSGINVTQYLLDLQPGLAQVIRDSQGYSYLSSPRGIHTVSDGSVWNYPMTDGLGSVRGNYFVNKGVVFPTNMTLSNIHYSEYGVPNKPFDKHAFTGEWRDTNDLQYHRARYYSPSLGIFPSLDPYEGTLQRPMSLNGYSWVEGNPVMNTDPSGLVTEDQIIKGENEYSCRCGWIDWNHAEYYKPLQLLENLDFARNSTDPFISGWAFVYQIEVSAAFITFNLFNDIAVVPKMTFDNISSLGGTKAIAVSVIMDANERFETIQGTSIFGDIPVAKRLKDSAFAEEDLVSDLIGFYRANEINEGRGENASQNHIRQLCGGFGISKEGIQASLDVYRNTYANGELLLHGVNEGWKEWRPRILELLDCDSNR